MKRCAAAALVALTCALSACGSDDEPQQPEQQAAPDTTSAPEGVSWMGLNGIQTPRSRACGQATGDGGVPVGYDHTPQCGVVAAINGQVALATVKDQEWPAVVNQIVAPGQGKNQWAQARAMQSITKPVANAARFVGFKIPTYDDQQMQVILAVTWPDGKTTAQVTQLAWQANTWKLVLPTQDKAPDAVEIKNLDGFTQFGAKKS